jgi:linoleoyl-CoA desaturase
VHYPALAKMVQEVCAEHGVPCRENVTLMDALRSHYNFVRQMGMKPAAGVAPTSLAELAR